MIGKADQCQMSCVLDCLELSVAEEKGRYGQGDSAPEGICGDRRLGAVKSECDYMALLVH